MGGLGAVALQQLPLSSYDPSSVALSYPGDICEIYISLVFLAHVFSKNAGQPGAGCLSLADTVSPLFPRVSVCVTLSLPVYDPVIPPLLGLPGPYITIPLPVWLHFAASFSMCLPPLTGILEHRGGR